MPSRHRSLARTLSTTLIGLSLVLPACAPGDQGARSASTGALANRAPYEPQIGQPGGLVSHATFGDPKTFNYGLAAETSSTDILGLCFASLVRMNGITADHEPSLAESWELQPDGLSYVFTLREGLKWSDGAPLTADDVVFSFKDVAMNYPAIPSNLHDGLKVEGKYIGVEKLDDRRIKFSADQPFGPFVAVVGGIPILPKHILGDAVHQKDASGKLKFNMMWGVDADVKSIVTNGPFMIDEYVPAQRTVLVRNPHYWEKDEAGNQLPYLERYVIHSVKDGSATLLKFKANEVDFNEPMRPADYEIMKPLEKDGDFTIYEGGPRSSTNFLIFNMTTAKDENGKPRLDPVKAKWFRNVHFRRAMQYAVDRDSMIKSVYRGLGEACYSAVQKPFSPFYDASGIETYAYSLAKAEEELKLGGFTKNDKGELIDSDGNRVQFTLQTNAGNTNRDAVCNMLRTDWAKLGLKVDYRPMEFNVLVSKIDETHDFDCVLLGLAGDSPDPHFGINTWLLDGKMHMFNLGKGTTHQPWEHEMQELFQRASTTTDQEERKRLYAQALKLEAEQLPFVYTVTEEYLCAVRNTVGNAYPTAMGKSSWNVQNQFMLTAK